MGLFRRSEPLHEQLAREGGLHVGPVAEPTPPALSPGGAGSAGGASSRAWMEAGIHGVPRAREWDAVVAVEAEGMEGDRARFVAFDDDLIVEEGGDVEPIAAALDDVIEPPYRAEAARRSETQWVVGLRRIQVVELPDDPGGDEATLTVHEGETTLVIDGAKTFASIRALEDVGSARGSSFVVQARRLDGQLWEVEVSPL